MSSFGISTRKDPVSMKLKAQNMHNAKDITRKLEDESRKMEERLNELKMVMNREKEERSQQEGFWGTGQQGNLGSYAKDVINKKSAGKKENREKEKNSAKKTKMKVTILKDTPIVVPERNKGPGTMAHIAKRSPVGGRVTGPRCGQCENRGANVSCQECCEDYCAGCFASFHLKGALRKHRSMPIGSSGVRAPRPAAHAHPHPEDQEKINPAIRSPSNPAIRSPSNPAIRSPSSASSVNHKPEIMSRYETPPSEGHTKKKVVTKTSSCREVATLLDGDYNEREQAAEFQRAIQEWRGEKAAASTNERSAPTTVNDGTCTLPEQHAPIEIRFKQSLTYAERLLLKRNRRADVEDLIGTDQIIDPDERSWAGAGSGRSELDLSSVVNLPSTQSDVDPYEQEFLRAGAESRVSIIDMDDDPVPRHSMRRMDQSSSYHVHEMPEGLDYYRTHPGVRESRAAFGNVSPSPPLNKPRTPTSGRRRHVKSPAAPDDADSTPILDLKALNAAKERSRLELRRESARSRGVDDDKENELMRLCSEYDESQSGRKSELEKYHNRRKKPASRVEMKLEKDAQGAQAKPKSGFTPRIKSRTGSRPSSRAASRVQSRADTRISAFGEGILTKAPSSALQSVARLSAALPSAPLDPVSLTDFFTAGVKPQPDDEATTPRLKSARSQSRIGSARPGSARPMTGREARPMTGRESKMEKYKLSNKIYQMAPRSWKPEVSVGDDYDDLSDAKMALQLQQGAEDMMNMFGNDEATLSSLVDDDSILPPGALQAAAVKEVTMSFSLAGSSEGGAGKREASFSKENTSALDSSIWNSVDSSRSISRKSKTSVRFDEPAHEKPVHNPSFSRVKARPGTPRTPKDPVRSRPVTPRSSRPVTPRTPDAMERPLSRTIVVDGDDMSQFDEELVAMQQERRDEDEDALYQLEWELASQDGRVTADGNISRMSVLDDLSEEDMELCISRDEGRHTGLSTPDQHLTDKQLRESVLMDDFEEMELNMQADDEDDVRGLC